MVPIGVLGADKDVNVVNTPYFRDADNPAFQPFQARVEDNAASLNLSDNEFFTVRSGKRVVIETVAVRILVPKDEILQRVELWTTTTSLPFGVPLFSQHHIEVTKLSSSDFFDIYLGTRDVRIYADAGTPVSFRVQRRSSSGDFTVSASISGYMVDL